MQPFLSAICPILIVSNICLELIYPGLGSSKLIRKLLSGLSGRLEVCLSRVSRLVNQPQNGTPCPVQLIGFRIRILPLRSIRNNGSPRICLSSHRSPPALTTCLGYFSKSKLRQFDIVDNPLVRAGHWRQFSNHWP